MKTSYIPHSILRARNTPQPLIPAHLLGMLARDELDHLRQLRAGAVLELLFRVAEDGVQDWEELGGEGYEGLVA